MEKKMTLYKLKENSQIDEFGIDHSKFSLRDEIEYNMMRAREKERQQSLNPASNEYSYYDRFNAHNRINQQKNVTPTKPDYSQPGELLFDGQNLSWQQNGKPVKYWKAMSGHPKLQGSQHTNVKDAGPIPEGDYVLKKDSGQDYGNIPLIQRLNAPITTKYDYWFEKPNSWGKSRVPIQPLPNTNTYGRDSMYVHGGTTLGSGGCIDLTSGNESFYNDFKNYNTDLPLKVKYPKGW
jgi:hypothetical protein